MNSVTSRRATEHPLTEDELNEMVRALAGPEFNTSLLPVRELQEQGPNQLNTLLESHMDVALDKWVAWCLRNTFNVPDGLGLVMVSEIHVHSNCQFG